MDHENGYCVICLDPLDNIEPPRSFPVCRHTLHGFCIGTYAYKMSLERENPFILIECPVCREPVDERFMHEQWCYFKRLRYWRLKTEFFQINPFLKMGQQCRDWCIDASKKRFEYVCGDSVHQDVSLLDLNRCPSWTVLDFAHLLYSSVFDTPYEQEFLQFANVYHDCVNECPSTEDCWIQLWLRARSEEE